jgi:pimeloyl-ACP methyl ester carboxylesterase
LHGPVTNTYSVSQDTYIEKKSASTNFGSSVLLKAGKGANGELSVAMVDFTASTAPPACTPGLIPRFDPCYIMGISPIDQILRAELILDVISATVSQGVEITLRLYPTSAFSEHSAVWTNSGDRAGPMADEVTITSGHLGPIEFDITAALQAGHRAFLVEVSGSGSDALVQFSSKEGSTSATIAVHDAAAELVSPDTGCTEHTVQVDEVTLHYTECPYLGNDNSPPVCLWVHGAPSNEDMWRNQHQYVQHGCRSIAVTLPGTGLSTDIALYNADGSKKPWIKEVGRIMVGFVNALNLNRVICIGQDYGSGACRWIDRAIDVNRLEAIVDIEGVVGPSILCSPQSEAANLCFHDAIGTPASEFGSFTQRCFLNDEVVPFNGNTVGCGTYILKRNWFFNITMSFDPNVIQYLPPTYAASAGHLMPVQPFLLANPIQPYNSVVNTLAYDIHPDILLDQVYDREIFLSLPEARQALQNWPTTLSQHGGQDTASSAEYRKLLIDTRISYMKGGLLAQVPKFFPVVLPGAVTQPVTSDMTWANNYYKNFWSGIVSRGAGHFYTEDQTGAQDVGLWMMENVL